MKNFILLLAICFIASSGTVNAQSSSQELKHTQHKVHLPAAYYKTTTAPVRETKFGVEDSEIDIDFRNVQIKSYGTYGPAARPDGTDGFGENLIYTSGPYMNKVPNLSIAEDVSEGIGTWGFGANKNSDRSLAEEFILPMDFDISSLDVYAYQTGTAPPSITGVYMQIWDGDPSGGSASIVWGDLNTNILEDVEDTGIYRVLESDQSNTDRKIQKVKANTNGLSLTTGAYWVEYAFDGSGSSGPWAPPVSVIGETITGNALQNQNGTWVALVDGTNDDPQGLPLQIYGIADNGGNSCVELNPAYDWYFEEGINITTGGAFSSANDLSLDVDESFTLKNISALLTSEWPITNVNITYYEDDNGNPGAVIGSENSATIDGSTAIGSINGSVSLNVYEVSMSVDPFEFTGQQNSATTYWIGLSATSSQNTSVYWVGTNGNMVGNPSSQDDGSGWTYYKSSFDGHYIWSGDCSPVLGVEDNNLVQFKVYPNPTHDVLYLETTKNIESLSLFNILGQEVLAGIPDKNANEISLAGLPVGTYILKATIEGHVETRKVIKR